MSPRRLPACPGIVATLAERRTRGAVVSERIPETRAASTLPGVPAPATDVEEIERTDEAAAPPWLTILHNCDCHTFEQVVRQLMKAIACSESRGWEIAWEVHNTGKAVVKVGPERECVRVGNVLAAIGLVVTVVQS
jgi:ATP-dependent Clp protease adaptor protein ClpS